MCGIAAIFSYHPAAPPIDRNELLTIRDSMRRRGPDGAGEWFSRDGRLGLGHRRLAIIDLSESGAQPMTADGDALVISFNGEIYNYRHLRSGLEAEGCVFRSGSDTEVILELYARRGERALEEMRGMYSLLLWDARRGALLLARDPFGIKPLYYADDGWVLRAASQVKALRSGGRVSSDVEPAGVAGFFLLGSVPEPHTVYREIRALPAGHTLWVDEAGPAAPRSRVSLAGIHGTAAADRQPRPGRDRDEAVREAFLDSIRHHMVADVPVGAFLSAGVDSTTIVSLAREVSGGPIRTVTLAFEEFRGTPSDESPLAEETARRLGTDHETRVITRTRFECEIPRLLEAMDQPTVDGVNSYFVSQAAAEARLKVALSGLGGDELLAGYPTFRSIPGIVRLTALPSRVPGLGRLARPLLRRLIAGRLPERYAGLLECGGDYGGAWMLRRGLFAPWELPRLLGDDLAREGLRRLDPHLLVRAPLDPDPGTPFARVSLLETSLYMRNQLLRDADWASMAHSLEVRVPLVDPVLWRRLGEILGPRGSGRSKAVLASASRPPLPADVTGRPKTGFFIPVWDWLAGSRVFESWRSVPLLSEPGFQGARRWAWTVFERAAVLPGPTP